MKKVLIVIVIILVLAIIGVGAWWFFQPLATPTGPSTSSGQATSSDFFPTGDLVSAPAITPANPTDENPPSDTVPNQTGLASAINQVSKQPIAGAFVAGQTATSAVLYVERATGHVYAAPTTGGDAATRLSQTTIPKIFLALGGKTTSGIKIILQYLKDGLRQNFLGNLQSATANLGDNFATTDNSSAVGQLAGSLLSSGLDQIALSPAQDKIFYLEQSGDQTIGSILSLNPVSKTNPAGPTIVFSSPFNEWLTSWPATNTVALLTKPSSAAPGWLYLLDLKTKVLRQAVGGIPGLMTLVDPKAQKVLVSGNFNQGWALGWFDLNKKTFAALPIKTFTDKCAWSHDGVMVYCGVPLNFASTGNYPDEWLSGEISFTDNLWQVNTLTGQAQIILNPELSNLGVKLDAYQLFLNNDESRLYFTNKRDSTLWSLDLKGGF